MKKSHSPLLQKALSALLLTSVVTTACAQKLPTVQKGPVYAPADAKADGKPAEWANFQAYNKSTEVFYTIANNDDNLYLVVQATDPDIINKVISGGVRFTIKSPDKKSTIAPVAITYPIMARPTPMAGGGGAATPGAPRVTAVRMNGMGPGAMRSGGGIAAKLKNDGPISDEDLAALNKQLTDNVKEIKITGVTEIPDTMVSVYNEQSIKAAGLIDNKKAYTYELCLPLKYLHQIAASGSFNYNITLNGLKIRSMVVEVRNVDAGGAQPARVMNISTGGGPGGDSSFQNLTSPTDFSGTYILAKK